MENQEVYVQVLGWVSMAISLIRAVPQIIKIFNIKSGRDVSVLSQVLMMVSGVFWVVYGFMKPDPTIYSTNLVIFLCAIVTLILKFYYRHHKKSAERKDLEQHYLELVQKSKN